MKKQSVRRMFCALLVLAMLAGTVPALGAEGRSEISGLGHIDRGYFGLDASLRELGADIRREHHT